MSCKTSEIEQELLVVDVLVPQIKEQIVASPVPQIQEQTMAMLLQEIMEQIVAFPVPRIKEDIVKSDSACALRPHSGSNRGTDPGSPCATHQR